MNNRNSKIEFFKNKKSESIFYNLFRDKLDGLKINNIVPFTNCYFDLLYVKSNYVAVFKFLDTTDDIFSILGEEIIEIIEEERDVFYANLKKSELKGINYYVFMPNISLSEYNINSNNIIDSRKAEKILEEDSFDSILTEYEGDISKLLDILTFEYCLINENYRDIEDKKINFLNTLDYDEYGVVGSTGVGKTGLMLSATTILSKLYPKDNFLYLTFDKKYVDIIKQKIHKNGKIKNITVMNFHKFISLLGRKYNIRLNSNASKNFEKSFNMLFDKVLKIYKDKNIFKGIFIDESENLSDEYISFVKSLVYKNKGVFFMSLDLPKRISGFKNNISVLPKNIINLNNNYRNLKKISSFRKSFENLINKFALLEIDFIGRYFNEFNVVKEEPGDLNIIYYNEVNEMLDVINERVKTLISKGYSNNDICIIYPYNKHNVSGKYIFVKKIIEDSLKNMGVNSVFLGDNSRSDVDSVSLANVFSTLNIEYKAIIACNLDAFYNEESVDDKIKLINYIYLVSGRCIEDLTILLKNVGSFNTPSIIDLVIQSNLGDI